MVGTDAQDLIDYDKVGEDAEEDIQSPSPARLVVFG
jgi:hypothetical protein